MAVVQVRKEGLKWSDGRPRPSKFGQGRSGTPRAPIKIKNDQLMPLYRRD